MNMSKHVEATQSRKPGLYTTMLLLTLFNTILTMLTVVVWVHHVRETSIEKFHRPDMDASLQDPRNVGLVGDDNSKSPPRKLTMSDAQTPRLRLQQPVDDNDSANNEEAEKEDADRADAKDVTIGQAVEKADAITATPQLKKLGAVKIEDGKVVGKPML